MPDFNTCLLHQLSDNLRSAALTAVGTECETNLLLCLLAWSDTGKVVQESCNGRQRVVLKGWGADDDCLGV